MVAGSSLDMRRRLVEHLRRRGLVHDPRVAGAFLAVPREVFLPETLARSGMGAVYQDDAIVTRRDPATMAPLSSSSQPAIMAIMLELLELRPGHRVLEIGAGTGYNAALLARLVDPDGLVVTLDIDPEIAEAAAGALRRFATGVHVVVADGAVGLPGLAVPGAQVDGIVVTASTAAIPQVWHEQLVLGGRLVVPLRLSDELDRAHAVTCLVKGADGFDSTTVTPGGFMPLRRPDGLPFDPTGRGLRLSTGTGSVAQGGAVAEPPCIPPSPLAEVAREDMDRLRITVRYSVEEPRTRWTFPRGDHWIGVDLLGS